MSSSRISVPARDPEIDLLLARFTPGLQAVLAENLIGLYLSGSLAYGDFVPERSDIDLQAIVRRPLDTNELAGVERLHHELLRAFPVWGDRVECSYVPIAWLSCTTPPAEPRPWWGFTQLYPEAPAGNEWIINHYFLRQYSVALHGSAFSTLMPPIDLAIVRQASAQDYYDEWLPKARDAVWLADPHQQSYLVLNLCRILHTVCGDGPGSKKAAASWARSTYPHWGPLIDAAGQWTIGQPMNRTDDALAFLRFAEIRIRASGILDPQAATL